MLRAGRLASPRETWIREALEEMKDLEGIERIGVWLEGLPRDEEIDRSPVVFAGQLWEPEEGQIPFEWTKLSAEAPLPIQVLSAGKSVEYDWETAGNISILGATVGLQHMIWVPVTSQRILRGLILVGAGKKQMPLARECAERVSAELGLLFELQEQRELAGTRREDLELWRQVQSDLAEQDAESILGRLAKSCTGDGEHGAGAVFALIGERKSGFSVRTPASASDEERLVVRGQGGDPAWEHGVEHGPLESFWRKAVQSRQVVGAEPGRLPQAKKISRIVAIPLEGDKVISGVLLAGLPKGRTSLEVLERLELRAKLAAQVLEREQRKDAEQGRESWRQALLESSMEPVALVDGHGYLHGMSRGARELTSRIGIKSTAEPDSHRLVEMFRPREWERVNQWWKASVARELPEDEVLEGELENGTIARLRRLPLSEGEFLALHLEAKELEKTHRQLAEVEEELRQTVGWLEEGVVLFDESGAIRAKNARFLQILGLSEEEGAQLKNVTDVIGYASKNAADPKWFAAEWRALAEIGEEGRQEELTMAKPVPRVVERCTRLIAGKNGKKLGRVEVYRELTTRRMFESRMLQTEKLAALGQRVSGIVHELSNPLTTILGNAQRMAQRNEGGRPCAETRQIVEEAERASAILRQLLDLSRDAKPDRRLVSINDLVERTVELQRSAISGSWVQLKLELEERLPRVEGNFPQLQQVLLNLLQNAQQAIEESGRGNTIGVRTALTRRGCVRLEVWDDGPGIPDAIQARIFDPFFTTKAPGIGTGLGLSIVQAFVRQHGGTVMLLNSGQEGARFIVELPAQEGVLAGSEPERSGEVTEEAMIRQEVMKAPRSNGGKESPRILVVEDEPTVGGLIADVLREEGMSVDVLLNGELALQRAEREAYDLLICDLKMPGMDGQNFYRELLRRNNPLSGRVLFVTGDLISPRTQEFLQRYRLPRVAKPFRVEELSQTVRNLLERKPKAAMTRVALAAERAMGNG